MSRYTEIKKEAIKCPMEGIFFAFSDQQFEEGLVKCGYTHDDVDQGKIVSGGVGDYGSREAFAKRHKYYEEMIERIRTECKPDEIFRYEFHNYESCYTGDYTEALEITREYFPKYTPSKKLLSNLFNEGD